MGFATTKVAKSKKVCRKARKYDMFFSDPFKRKYTWEKDAKRVKRGEKTI